MSTVVSLLSMRIRSSKTSNKADDILLNYNSIIIASHVQNVNEYKYLFKVIVNKKYYTCNYIKFQFYFKTSYFIENTLLLLFIYKT